MGVSLDFEFLTPGRACADIPALENFDVGDVGAVVLRARAGAPATGPDVFDTGCVGVAVLVLRTGVPAALVGGGATTREPLRSSPGRVASFASIGGRSALADVVRPSMGALGTVAGFLDVWTRDVLLKPSVSKLCIDVSSFEGGSGKGFLDGEVFFFTAGLAGVPFGFEDPIVWDHIAQEGKP